MARRAQSSSGSEDEEVFEVEKIVNHKVRARGEKEEHSECRRSTGEDAERCAPPLSNSQRLIHEDERTGSSVSARAQT